MEKGESLFNSSVNSATRWLIDRFAPEDRFIETPKNLSKEEQKLYKITIRQALNVLKVCKNELDSLDYSQKALILSIVHLNIVNQRSEVSPAYSEVETEIESKIGRFLESLGKQAGLDVKDPKVKLKLFDYRTCAERFCGEMLAENVTEETYKELKEKSKLLSIPSGLPKLSGE